MSRRAKPPEPDGFEWVVGDLATGSGLEAAVAGIDVVAHLASLPYRGPRTDRVDIEGTGRLVRAAADAGVSHVIYTSIVGVDTIPWPYFRKKLAAEERVRSGPVEWSIIRATQFYPLLDAALSATSRLPVVFGPTDVPGQPVDPCDVADRLVQQISAGPSGEVVDLGGPEILSFGELATQWMEVRGRRKRLLRVPIPGRLGRAFRAGNALAASGGTGTRTWRSWLERRYLHSSNDKGDASSSG